MLDFFAKKSSGKEFLILLWLHAVESFQLGAKNKNEKINFVGIISMH